VLDGAALDDPSREPKPVPGPFSMLDRSDPGRTPEAGRVLGRDLSIRGFQVRFLAGASEAAGAELGSHAAKGQKRRTEGGEHLFDGEAAKVSEGSQ